MPGSPPSDHVLSTALLAVVGALLACGGGGSDAKCVSAIEIGSVRFSALGTASNPAEAKKNSVTGTCIAYCTWGGDPAVETAYQAWKTANPSSKARREAVLTVHIHKDVKACEARCAGEVESGRATVKTECP